MSNISEPPKKKFKQTVTDCEQKLNKINSTNQSDTMHMQQNMLVVIGYIRRISKEYNITIFDDIQQICHEFYHKNVIVYQTKEYDAFIDKYITDKIGGLDGGGNDYKYISTQQSILTKLSVATITLYSEGSFRSIHPQYLSRFGIDDINELEKEFAISICGYQFETDDAIRQCQIGYPPYGVTNKRIISLKSRPNEYCNSVEIYYGGTFNGVRAIQFMTNHQQIILIGKITDENGKQWHKKTITPPHLQYGIIGFGGKSGWLIDSFSCVFAPQ